MVFTIFNLLLCNYLFEGRFCFVRKEGLALKITFSRTAFLITFLAVD